MGKLKTQLNEYSPTPHVRTRNARARVLITTSGCRGRWGHSATGYKCVINRLQIQMFNNSGGMFVPPCEPSQFAK